ncbi:MULTISPECIES: 2-phospho-L-lactate guanylyltransferase [unclassified Knoellia]|uniref:2-phospho-L-lactate guanylyltransferase n=1 Tax=Knoellia altitudinis TaxID=3404795 RepID=UPI00360EFF21
MESPRETDWHVVVPVKGGLTAKSRLRRQVDDEALVTAIIHDTLDVVARVVTPARVVVVTADPGEAAHARSTGLVVVSDPGGGLNAACRAGFRSLRRRGIGPVAILLGDHPALTDDELSTALAAGADLATFFVPDADGLGTALVGSTVAAELDLAFGPGSADRHASLGHVRLDLDLPGLRHDVDDEVSLRHAADHLTLGPRTLRALER